MRQKQSHALSTAACSIYDYDDDISCDSSSHAEETDSEDEQGEFERYHDGSAAHIQACMYCLSEQQPVVSTNAAEIDPDEDRISQSYIVTQIPTHPILKNKDMKKFLLSQIYTLG